MKVELEHWKTRRLSCQGDPKVVRSIGGLYDYITICSWLWFISKYSRKNKEKKEQLDIPNNSKLQQQIQSNIRVFLTKILGTRYGPVGTRFLWF